MTKEQKRKLFIEAAGFVLIDGDIPLEDQVKTLEKANPMDIHIIGVEPTELYEYYNAKNLLKEIEVYHYTLCRVFEDGVKSVTEIRPNIQHIKPINK